METLLESVEAIEYKLSLCIARLKKARFWKARGHLAERFSRHCFSDC